MKHICFVFLSNEVSNFLRNASYAAEEFTDDEITDNTRNILI